MRSRQTGKGCSEGNLEIGILSLGQDRVRAEPGTPGPLRAQFNREVAPPDSWWKQTQIISREKPPQLGLLEDRLRQSNEITEFAIIEIQSLTSAEGETKIPWVQVNVRQSKDAHTRTAK